MTAALTSTTKLTEAFSLALEDRSPGYTDLVSNANVVFATMKERGGFQTFSGPTIRERLLYNESGTFIRYSGFDILNPQPVELINDAEFTPQQCAVSVTISNDNILKNQGAAQLMSLFKVHMDAAENELIDRFVEDMHSAGTETNQIGGLQAMIPTTVTNTYGGISRNTNAIWKTTTYDANSLTIAGASITSIISTTIKPILNYTTIKRSRGNKGPNLILMAENPFIAYSAATEAIQRITDTTSSSKFGFTSLKYYGGGRSIDIVMEGGIGTAMPADIIYLMDMDAIKLRYHPDRNFAPFGGKQMPTNQDAIVQHIGFFGELTLNNPLHCAKIYDSA